MSTNSATVNASAAGTLALGGDLTVNRMGFGTMRLTGAGIWGEPANPVECKAVLRRAVQLAVNFMDTADSYGPDVAERLTADTLYPYPKGFVIATKGGLLRTGPGQWPHDGRPEHLREALEGSLSRLRLEQIDLYQFHRPDPRVPFAESVGALADMRQEGKIRHVGLSNVTTEQLSEAQHIVPVVSVQNRYNLTERMSADVLAACERGGLAFIPWGPLAEGSLLQSGSTIDQIARRHEATPAQIVLAWLLRHSPVMLVIPGTSQVSHLEENVAAAGIQLTDQDVTDLNGLAGANR